MPIGCQAATRYACSPCRIRGAGRAVPSGALIARLTVVRIGSVEVCIRGMEWLALALPVPVEVFC